MKKRVFLITAVVIISYITSFTCFSEDADITDGPVSENGTIKALDNDGELENRAIDAMEEDTLRREDDIVFIITGSSGRDLLPEEAENRRNYLRAYLFLREKNFSEAVSGYEKVLDYYHESGGKYPPPGVVNNIHFDIAQCYLEIKDYSRAHHHALKVLKGLDTTGVEFCEAGKFFMPVVGTIELTRVCGAGLEKDPRSVEPFMPPVKLMGEVATKKEIETSAALLPKQKELLKILLITAPKTGMKELGERYRHLFDNQRKNPEAEELFKYVVAYSCFAGEEEEREKLSGELASLSPAFKERADEIRSGGMKIVGEVYRRLGFKDEMIEIYWRQIEVNPDDSENFKILYRILLCPRNLTESDVDRASKSVNRLVGLYPDDEYAERACKYLGDAYYSLVKNAKAIGAWQFTLKKYNRPWKHQYDLPFKIGCAYQAMGETQKAVEAWKNAIPEAPPYFKGKLHYRIARLYHISGDFPGAVREYKKISEMDYHDRWTGYALNRLKELERF